MLDIVLLRKDLDAAVARLQTRKNPQPFLNVEAFRALEGERKTLQTRTEELQSQRNSLSKQIGMLKGKGNMPRPMRSWRRWALSRTSWTLPHNALK